MSQNRKDSKGRVLRTGESQRKDLIYQYRYMDVHGKRQTVYSSDLKELREEEKVIQKNLDEAIDYAAGEITVRALVERYIGLKKGVRQGTKYVYQCTLKLLRSDEFSLRSIRDIKMSDAQKWMIDLNESGKGFNTISHIRSMVKSAFQMACNEDAIQRNPFDFNLADIIPNDSKQRAALTPEQQKVWMDFIREDNRFSKHYDIFVVLLGTGMGVSEFCGLTKKDLDFEHRRICVDHQLLRERGGSGKLYIEKTKTQCGLRFIPMTNDVCQSLQNILADRRKVKIEVPVDGYTGFLLIGKDGRPRVAMDIENIVRFARDAYKKRYPEHPLPHVSPHVFRHTFCTNMANAGMDVKTLQYIMGHSNVGVTLNVYTHASFDHAAEQMFRIMDFKELDKQMSRKKSS